MNRVETFFFRTLAVVALAITGTAFAAAPVEVGSLETETVYINSADSHKLVKLVPPEVMDAVYASTMPAVTDLPDMIMMANEQIKEYTTKFHFNEDRSLIPIVADLLKMAQDLQAEAKNDPEAANALLVLQKSNNAVMDLAAKVIGGSQEAIAKLVALSAPLKGRSLMAMTLKGFDKYVELRRLCLDRRDRNQMAAGTGIAWAVLVSARSLTAARTSYDKYLIAQARMIAMHYTPMQLQGALNISAKEKEAGNQSPAQLITLTLMPDISELPKLVALAAEQLNGVQTDWGKKSTAQLKAVLISVKQLQKAMEAAPEDAKGLLYLREHRGEIISGFDNAADHATDGNEEDLIKWRAFAAKALANRLVPTALRVAQELNASREFVLPFAATPLLEPARTWLVLRADSIPQANDSLAALERAGSDYLDYQLVNTAYARPYVRHNSNWFEDLYNSVQKEHEDQSAADAERHRADERFYHPEYSK